MSLESADKFRLTCDKNQSTSRILTHNLGMVQAAWKEEVHVILWVSMKYILVDIIHTKYMMGWEFNIGLLDRPLMN